MVPVECPLLTAPLHVPLLLALQQQRQRLHIQRREQDQLEHPCHWRTILWASEEDGCGCVSDLWVDHLEGQVVEDCLLHHPLLRLTLPDPAHHLPALPVRQYHAVRPTLRVQHLHTQHTILLRIIPLVIF